MNPPFGEPAVGSVDYLRTAYPNARLDAYAAAVIRGIEMLHPAGFIGAITSRTGFFLSSLARWRESILRTCTFEVWADQGAKVLDSGLDSAASYVFCKQPTLHPTWVIPLLDLNPGERDALAGSICSLTEGGRRLIVRDFRQFSNVPGMAFCYWLQDKAIKLLSQARRFKGNGRDVRQGMATGDNSLTGKPLV